MIDQVLATPTDIDFLIEETKRRPSTVRETDIAKWIEGRRILPPRTPFPGYWRNDRTPYLNEIMNNMSPESSVLHAAIMKAAQLGLTAACENVIAYWMSANPSEILYISATDKLLNKWVTKRLEPLIESCEIEIRSTSNNPKSRRTGDTMFSKEFPGGSLDMGSAQSAAGMRSDSKRILVRDEIDGAPRTLRTGEGNWLQVSYARTIAWGNRKKIMDFSTPTTFEESLINELYESGDQRKFEVPCPYCGTGQFLEWGDDKTQYGVKAETEGGKLVSVYYQCEKCHEGIKNHHKTRMLSHGKWVPTAESHSDQFRSYHLSSLYSPAGMMTWYEMFELWREAEQSGDPDEMRAFINLYLGLPFRETGERPKLDKVVELRGGYESGNVPHGVLFLTIGIDVQRGSERNEENPARLEMEVCGHGAGYRTWSILYRRFEGAIDDTDAGAWAELSEWATDTGMLFARSDGRNFTPKMILIDSGDGQTTHTVYEFCEGWQGTYPSKGFGFLVTGAKETSDPQTAHNKRRYRAAKLGQASTLYEISTNYYKTKLYDNLKKERKDTGRQKAGFCDFPRDYDYKYFKMLTAEEKKRDGSFHCPSGRRNEALDCRVMNLCAGDVWLDGQVMNFKAAAKAAGATPDQVQLINHRWVLDYLTKQTAPLRVDHYEKEE